MPSTEFERFKSDLVALCEKHSVQLAPSAYDFIEVWRKKQGEPAIYSESLVDKMQDADD